jgi:hypothetical protein
MLAVLAPMTVAAGEEHEVVAPKVAEVECGNPACGWCG